MQKQFIGGKKILEVKPTEQKTPGGAEILEVLFEDETSQFFSKLMLDNIITENKIDETELRNKRVDPIVEVILTILREYGVKTGELPYFSALLNKSLDYNSNQALLKLLGKWMPQPLSLDDVDFITIDRILKADGESSKQA